MAKENTTLYIILGLLTHEEMSGYDIKKRIDETVSYFWTAGYGQIYPTLKVLVGEGLIAKREAPERGGPERIVYVITEEGRVSLKKWLATTHEKEYVKYELLLKLFFGNLLPATENLKKIEEFQSCKMKELQMMELFKENLEKVIDAESAHIYYYLTVLFGEHINKAYIAWAQEAQDLLENVIKNNPKNKSFI